MSEFTHLVLNHADVHGFLFAEGAFVYSAKAEAAKALNARSCWLLLQLEEGASEQALIKACQQQDPNVPLALLQQELAQLKALQQGEIATDPEPWFVATIKQFPLVVTAQPQQGFDVGGLCVQVVDLPNELKPYLAELLLHKPLCQSREVCLLKFVAEADGFCLWLNNKPWPQRLKAYEVAPVVLSIVRRLSAMQQPFFATAHAALADINQKRWMFSGSSGAGKSTLSAQLLALGQQVLSDEVVLLDARGHAQAAPLALGLKENSWPLLEGKFALHVTKVHRRLNGIKVKYLEHAGNPAPQKLHALCFVCFDAKQPEPFVLTDLSTFAAVQKLFANGLELSCFSLENFTQLLQLVEATPCKALCFHNSAAAAKHLLEFVKQ